MADYAGARIPIYDPGGGKVRESSLFVAELGASNYTCKKRGSPQG